MPRKATPQARLCWTLDGFTEIDQPGPNRLAADAVVEVVIEAFDDRSTALLTSFTMLAAAVDADPTNAALWGQYRAAEEAVREVATRGDDDEFSRLMARLSAPIPDTEVAEP